MEGEREKEGIIEREGSGRGKREIFRDQGERGDGGLRVRLEIERHRSQIEVREIEEREVSRRRERRGEDEDQS